MSGLVLVTGAGGFIGRAVAARLREAGLPVRAGLRRLPEGTAPDAEHVGSTLPDSAIVACDLDAPGTVEASCAGVETIVHAAGRTAAAMRGHMRILLDAAGRAGVDRIVLFSSVAVYGDREGRIAEDDAPGALDAYGSAKRDCEAMLRDWVGAAPGRRAVVLRPGIVYGPGSDLWIERPSAALRAGVLGSFGARGDGIAALIHVADVAEATRAAVATLAAPGPAESVFNLVGPDTPRWNAYVARLAERLGLGRPRTIGPVRHALHRALAVPAKVLARFGLPIPDALRLVPAAGEVRLFARAARYQTARAERILGFRPAIDFDRGLDTCFPPAFTDRAGAYAVGRNPEMAHANATSPENAPAAR